MNNIVDSIKGIHPQHRLGNSDVSGHTKSAQKITIEWQKAVQNESVKAEFPVSPKNKEKIDIVDFANNTAYELKVSGKNVHHEFFKDVFKVLTFNEYQEANERLGKLVFISEQSGINSLRGRLDVKLIALLQERHNLSIELIGI